MSIWLPVDDDLPMTTPDKADVAVTQADRDRTQAFYAACDASMTVDDQELLDRYFARHRLAATPPPASAGEVRAAEQFKVSGSHLNEGEVEAVARAISDSHNDAGLPHLPWQFYEKDALAAIAAMSPRVEDEAVEAETYRQMHDIAVNDLGYASILEALEATPAALSTPSPEKDETIAALWACLPFARHSQLCGIVGGYGFCTCGLDTALARLPDAGEGKC